MRISGGRYESAHRRRRRDRHRLRAHLAATGNAVSVLSHPPRTVEIASGGLAARDVPGETRTEAEAAVVPDASGEYDIVKVAIRPDQLTSACAKLAALAGRPAVVFFGNYPDVAVMPKWGLGGGVSAGWGGGLAA